MVYKVAIVFLLGYLVKGIIWVFIKVTFIDSTDFESHEFFTWPYYSTKFMIKKIVEKFGEPRFFSYVKDKLQF